MAKRERNKRAARKARQQERERLEAARAVSAPKEEKSSKSFFKKDKAATSKYDKSGKSAPVSKADRKGFQVVTGYFADVRKEMRQVTWPSRTELRNYSVAVIATLIVFGVLIWLVDTGFVAALVNYTGLRG